MRVVNLDVGSYLHQTSVKALVKMEKDKKSGGATLPEAMDGYIHP